MTRSCSFRTANLISTCARRSGLQVQRPASGLVTAVEPVMRACSGTWIAHGSGRRSRNRRTERITSRYRRRPGYTLRRIWLTHEQEGYYYGLANEGLWPLCHIAHVRPIFRTQDWEQYATVNQRFAEAVVDEAQIRRSVVLVQDYHFALLPRMVRERLPRATIITFWHIPWPNPESFGICPWREEILGGCWAAPSSASTRSFTATTSWNGRPLPRGRIDREQIDRRPRRQPHAGRPLPDLHRVAPAAGSDQPVGSRVSRRSVRGRSGLPPRRPAGVGVERLDYTKGIVERLRAVERLLEQHPEWIGRFTFVQIAAPSRDRRSTSIGSFEPRRRARPARDQRRFGARRLRPDRPAGRASRAANGLRATTAPPTSAW